MKTFMIELYTEGRTIYRNYITSATTETAMIAAQAVVIKARLKGFAAPILATVTTESMIYENNY